MLSRLSVEKLVIDDSFINYCLERNEQDISYWYQYQLDHPEQQDIIAEARQLVFLMSGSLKGMTVPSIRTSFSRQKNKSAKDHHLCRSLRGNNFCHISLAWQKNNTNPDQSQVKAAPVENSLVYTDQTGHQTNHYTS